MQRVVQLWSVGMIVMPLTFCVVLALALALGDNAHANGNPCADGYVWVAGESGNGQCYALPQYDAARPYATYTDLFYYQYGFLPCDGGETLVEDGSCVPATFSAGV